MKRAPNFSSNEVSLLLDIIETKADLVNCKKTDKVSVDKKDKVWKLIALEFNERSVCNPYRDAYTLRKKHENMKKTMKRRSNEKLDGTHVKQLKTSLAVDEQTDHGIFSCSDSEFILNHLSDTTEASSTSKDEELETEIATSARKSFENCLQVEEPFDFNEPVTASESIANRSKSKQPKNSKPYVPTNSVDRKFNWVNLAKAKVKWAEEKLKIEIQILRKEHEQRIRFMREKHEIEMKILQNELTKSELVLGTTI